MREFGNFSLKLFIIYLSFIIYILDDDVVEYSDTAELFSRILERYDNSESFGMRNGP